MSSEAWMVIFAVTSVSFGLAIVAFVIYVFRTRETRDWRADFRALQLENNRYLRQVHDENTRFFRSIGLTTQQIFERVDGGRHYDPEGP